MTTRVALPALILALLCAGHAAAQAPAANRPDPGITPVRQMDRAEVRGTRVELAPHAVRSVHTHDDVRFHLFIPVSGTLELTIGSAAPVAATPGQVFFLTKGTPHGFRNTGDAPAMVMEVFVKDAPASAQRGSSHGADGADVPDAQTLDALLALASRAGAR